MLRIITLPAQLNLEQLTHVYSQSIQARVRELNQYLSDYECTIMAEEEFRSFWRDVFFREAGSICAVLEENGKYVSALRLQNYRDGLLLSGLETEPANRNRGMAGKLMVEIRKYLEDAGCTKVYSHIKKDNLPSRKVHISCGFELLREGAVLLDGSASWSYDTYILKI